MKKLHLYWVDELGEEEGLVGTLWIEDGRLVVRPRAPEFRETVDSLVEWFSSRNLCSREVIDFAEFSSFMVPAECLLDDEDYLETLAKAAEECPLGERRLRGGITG